MSIFLVLLAIFRMCYPHIEYKSTFGYINERWAVNARYTLCSYADLVGLRSFWPLE